MDGWMDGWMDGLTDRWMGEQMDEWRCSQYPHHFFQKHWDNNYKYMYCPNIYTGIYMV